MRLPAREQRAPFDRTVITPNRKMNPANAFRRHPALRMVSAAGAGLG